MSDDIEKRLGDFLRAQKIVEAINSNIPEGITPMQKLPSDYVFKTLDRDAAGIALMASFEALGGVPAMIAWAAQDTKNQGKIYEWLMKQIPTETKVEHSGNLIVEGSLGDSPFDAFTGDRNAEHQSH